MTNTELLEDKIKASGKKKKYLAERCGLSPAGFWRCCHNLAEFKVGQVEILCQELEITRLTERQAIFFAN